MNFLPLASLAVLSLLSSVSAQEPQAPSAAAQGQDRGTWSEGFGRATSYRAALAAALEDAVGKAKGIDVKRGAGVRSRLSVVADAKEGVQEGWLNGDSEADGEREWVQQQIAGFVLRYDIVDKKKAEDRQWEVTVKALIASAESFDDTVVVDLEDNDLRKWQLTRCDEDRGGAEVGKQGGEFAGPKVGEYLRKSRLVKIAAKGAGVQVGAGAAVKEREKAGHQLVPSHKVTIQWDRLEVQSLIDRTNRARPTSAPRPEFLTGGSVQVSLHVDDLVENVVLLDETFAVTADQGATPAAQIDGYVTALVDKAKAIVAEKVFFALKPPTVVRKWQKGGDGEWLVEVRMARRVAATYREFVIGNSGSLASPDWQPLGRAVFVDGNDQSCTFRLEDVAEPARVEPNVTEVRPTKN